MKKVLSVLFLLVMLFTAVMPMALAEETNVNETESEAFIGGADEPTAIVVEDPAEENDVGPVVLAEEAAEVAEEETAEEAAEEKPLSIGESALFMLKGMVGIFLVTGLIILVLVIMDKAGNRKKETEE